LRADAAASKARRQFAALDKHGASDIARDAGVTVRLLKPSSSAEIIGIEE
jgi:hypothetical protein